MRRGRRVPRAEHQPVAAAAGPHQRTDRHAGKGQAEVEDKGKKQKKAKKHKKHKKAKKHKTKRGKHHG